MTQETIILLDSLRLALARAKQDLEQLEAWEKNFGTKDTSFHLSISGYESNRFILQRDISPEEAKRIFYNYKSEVETRRDNLQRQIDDL